MPPSPRNLAAALAGTAPPRVELPAPCSLPENTKPRRFCVHLDDKSSVFIGADFTCTTDRERLFYRDKVLIASISLAKLMYMTVEDV